MMCACSQPATAPVPLAVQHHSCGQVTAGTANGSALSNAHCYDSDIRLLWPLSDSPLVGCGAVHCSAAAPERVEDSNCRCQCCSETPLPLPIARQGLEKSCDSSRPGGVPVGTAELGHAAARASLDALEKNKEAMKTAKAEATERAHFVASDTLNKITEIYS
eukprot:2766055-Rhodomonas_salina.2